MSLRFVADEHLRGRLAQAIRRHNDDGHPFLDLVSVGDPPDLPLGTSDPRLLEWAERADRLLLTRDVKTMPTHLADHLAAGRSSPGVLVVRDGFSLTEIVELLELVAYACDPTEFVDQITYIP